MYCLRYDDYNINILITLKMKILFSEIQEKIEQV